MVKVKGVLQALMTSYVPQSAEYADVSFFIFSITSECGCGGGQILCISTDVPLLVRNKIAKWCIYSNAPIILYWRDLTLHI